MNIIRCGAYVDDYTNGGKMTALITAASVLNEMHTNIQSGSSSMLRHLLQYSCWRVSIQTDIHKLCSVSSLLMIRPLHKGVGNECTSSTGSDVHWVSTAALLLESTICILILHKLCTIGDISWAVFHISIIS
jgi:hypothetical protein